MNVELLSIVIPTYNGKRFLADCIPSVLGAIRRAGIAGQIVVVDDGSTDNSAAWLSEKFPQVEVVTMPENGGIARAVNAGLRAAKGDWIALLNNDVIVSDNWVAAAFAPPVGPDVGSIATQILYQANAAIINSAGDEYASCGAAVQWLDGRPVQADNSPRHCFSACAAAAFYRRAALDKTGLLRESLGAYYEDVDLGFRLNLAGYRCRYVPEAKCWHYGSASYGHRSWRVLYNSSRNREIVFWGNMPAPLLLKYAPSHLFMVFAQLCWSVLAWELPPKALGALAALGRIPEILRFRREAKALRAIPIREMEQRLWRDWGEELIVRRLRNFARKRAKPTASSPVTPADEPPASPQYSLRELAALPKETVQTRK